MERSHPTASERAYGDYSDRTGSGGDRYVDVLKAVQPKQGPFGIQLDDHIDITGPYGPFNPFEDPAW